HYGHVRARKRFIDEARQQDARNIAITLIESARVPTIGVGEGTLPFMATHLKVLGIPETEFLKRCDASFKFGVRFVDWNRAASGQSISFTHGFGSFVPKLPQVHGIEHFAAFGALTGGNARDCYEHTDP